MTKDEDFKLLKIQTFVLKVNIDCDGCKQKVKKILQRIEGVYQVNIDAEQQKVTVSGNVEYATLIKKLVRVGKHAELWSQKSVQNQNLKNNCVKEQNNKNKGGKQGAIKGLEDFKNQQKFPFYIPEEDEDCFGDEDGEEYDEEDELRIMTERANQLGLLRQPGAIEAINLKRPGSINNAKMAGNVGNGNGNHKKAILSQNMGMKGNPGGLDPKSMAALQTKNAQFGGGNLNTMEGKRLNDMNAAIMGLSHLQGNGTNINPAAAFGGNPNGLGGFQVQNSNGFPGHFPAVGLSSNGYATGQHPSSMLMNMSGHNHPSSMVMNMQNRNVMQQQPQLMYQRSPYIPPSTGYYYNYYGPPSPYYSYNYSEPSYSSAGDNSFSTVSTIHDEHSDDSTVECSIM